MKNKKFITLFMTCVFALSCFSFVACDDENNSSNNNTSNNNYNNDYGDEDEWTNNH